MLKLASAFFRFDSSVLFAGKEDFSIAGRNFSQIRFNTPCMSRVPLVIEITASCSGITMQYWPKAPSPRYAPFRQRQNWKP